MDYVVPTIYQAQCTTAQLLGKPYVPLQNTTLNEKWGIYDTLIPSSSTYPTLKYLAIGNGGHKVLDTSGGPPYSINPVQHKPINVSLYNHLPWIIRPANNDLTPTERLQYRMRVPVTIQGDDYIAYYLKLVDTSSTNPTINVVTWNTTRVSSPLSGGGSVLNPIPTTNNSTAGDDYVTVDAELPIRIDNAQQNEIRNAGNLIYGDMAKVVISELGLYMGIDTVVNAVDSSSNPFTYTETIYTQPTVLMNTFISLQHSVNNIELDLGIGCAEPMQL